MVEIVMTPLDVGTEAAREAATLLSRDERLRANRFARARDRQRFTVARAQLRRELGARLSAAPRAIAFACGRNGKPRLSGSLGGTDLRFSVSHCGNAAAFAFATRREVGVDIETLRPVRGAGAIVAEFSSPAERRDYGSLPEDQKLRGFFNWWTRKEAFVKAKGAGLSHPLDSFDVSLAPGAPARLLRIGDGADWALEAFAPGPGLIGAVVFARNGSEAEGAAPVVVRPLGPSPRFVTCEMGAETVAGGE